MARGPGRKATYISIGEDGTYLYRRRYPKDAPQQLAGKIHSRSLLTSNYQEALRRRPAAEAEYMRVINPPPAAAVRAVLAANHGIPATWSDEQAATALRLYDLAIQADAEMPEPAIKLSLEVTADASPQTRAAAMEDAIARHWAAQHGPDRPEQGDLRTAAERAEDMQAIEAQRKKGLLMPWPPVPRSPPPEHYRRGAEYRATAEDMGLDADIGPTDPRALMVQAGWAAPASPDPPAPATSNTVIGLMERYIVEDKIIDKTAAGLRRAAILFSQVVGDRDVGEVALDGDAVATYRLQLLDAPDARRLKGADKQLTMAQYIEKYQGTNYEKLSSAAINRCITGLSGCFRWAAGFKIVKENPFENAKVAKGKAKRTARRLPYSLSELNKIFSSPIYTDNFRPDAAGGEAHYWLPVLGLYSGCRLEEMGQIDLDDIKVIEVKKRKYTYFDLTFGDDKSLKTETSKRYIPIHSAVMKMGFDRYIAHVKRTGAKKLFPELTQNVHGQYTQIWSKFWGRWTDGLDITDPGKVFHSFRHNFKRNVIRSKIHPELGRILMGHQPADAHQGYGGLDEDVPELAAALELVVTEDLDLSHLRWELPPQQR